MDRQYLERATRALLPELRIWDGWKVRIPFNTVGVFEAIFNHQKASSSSYDIEVELRGRHKVNLTLLVTPTTSYTSTQLAEAVQGTAKDGEICVLAPLTWAGSTVLKATKDTLPDLFLLPRCLGRSFAWFVWSRDRKGIWRALSVED